MTTTALIGTAKGPFVLTTSEGARPPSAAPCSWESVDATLLDTRRDPAHPTWFVGSMSFHWGPTLRRSDDAWAPGPRRTRRRSHSRRGAGASVARTWQLAPGPLDDPDVVYAGVEPAALFRSRDGGRSFQLVEGLWNHPHAPSGSQWCWR
jgi:hypothetical protein